MMFLRVLFVFFFAFLRRRRKVDTEEPPGAEASGPVGLHGPVQNKPRSPGGHQLSRTVSSPVCVSAPPPLPIAPLLLPPLCRLSHQTTRHMYRNRQQPSVGCSGNRSSVKAKRGPAPYFSPPTHVNIQKSTQGRSALPRCHAGTPTAAAAAVAAAVYTVSNTHTHGCLCMCACMRGFCRAAAD